MPGLIVHQFFLPNTQQSIVPSVKNILGFINSNLQKDNIADDVSFKAEVIIIELLTNSLKHAGNTETFIDVIIDKESILIKKKDFGNRFNPGNITPLLLKPGYRAQLSKDDLHSMYAVVESADQIRFICEEINKDGPLAFNGIIEHFGLLIITKTADEFIYQYDNTLGLNCFNVRINY